MKKPFKQGLGLLLAVAELFSVTCTAQAVSAGDAQNEQVSWNKSKQEYDGYLIGLNQPLSEESLQSYEIQGLESLTDEGDLLRADDVAEVLTLTEVDNIAYIEPDWLLTLDAEIASASEEMNQPHYDLIGVSHALELGITGTDLDLIYDLDGDGNAKDDIVVAVIDSGLASGHTDLDYSRVLEGMNYVADESGTEDTLGHGTFVTGLILAVGNNGIGIAGAAQNVQVLPVRAFSAKDTKTSNVVNALNDLVALRTAYEESGGEEGLAVSVVNMSFGGANPSASLEAAVHSLLDAGIIAVCSAGNGGGTDACYPAQYAMGVGSVSSVGTHSSFSRELNQENGDGYENKVWVCAPGQNISSLWYTGTYYRGSGTSYAAPLVTALAAISLSLCNDLTSVVPNSLQNQEAFCTLLRQTAQPASSGTEINGQDVCFGWGIASYSNMISALTCSLTLTVTSNTEEDGVQNPIVIVYNSAGEPMSQIDDSWVLPVGSYLISVQAEGYQVREYAFLVDSASLGSTQQLTLRLLPENTTCDHQFELQNARQATCTNLGYTGDLVCVNCGKIQEQGVFVPQLDHDWDKGTVQAPATEDQAGVLAFTCAFCGAMRWEKLPQLDCPSLQFSDLNPLMWYHTAVDWALSTGTAAGMGDGVFGAEVSCTRAQIVTFLWNRAGKPLPQQQDNPFTDVEESNWYYSAVLWAVEQGITAGITSTTFAPDQVCTRAQAVTFLYNQQGRPVATGTSPFTDVQPGNWYYDPVLWAVQNQVTAGMGDGTFGADQSCTRVQIVQFLYNCLSFE